MTRAAWLGALARPQHHDHVVGLDASVEPARARGLVGRVQCERLGRPADTGRGEPRPELVPALKAECPALLKGVVGRWRLTSGSGRATPLRANLGRGLPATRGGGGTAMLRRRQGGCDSPRRGPRLGHSRWSAAYYEGGRYWVRTSDLFRVKEARYHCANRPGRVVLGGLEVETGFEPVYAALQAAASPLGHSTVKA